MDPLAVLQKLKELGFQFLTLQRYERQVAAERGGFVVLLEYTAGGEIRQFSSAGYMLEGDIGVLVERGGQSFFVAKQKQVRATEEMLALYWQFQADLRSALGQRSV